MVRNSAIGRLKAAFVSAAMIATTLAAPAMTSLNSVTAATAEGKTPYTFTADGVEDGGRQANIALPTGTKKGDTIYLNFTTSSTVNASIGVYGFGTDSASDGDTGYWYTIPEASQPSFSSGGKSSFQCEVQIPTAMVGNPTKIGLGIWYPSDNSKWTLESITKTGSSVTEPDEPDIPVTANDKSGTYTFVDNHDGTATISATLSAQYTETDANGDPQTQFDYVLTQGTDEEQYAPYTDAEGNTYPEWQEGDPINSHKFKFSNFGIDDISNVTFQSFQYAIESPDYDMSTLQYGGGINVQKGSPADTESVKGKDGYWYNDQGAEDMDGNTFLIDDVHGAYEATGCGSYAEITWDVPKGVQPYVDFSNSANAVGFQYWWGKDDTKTSTGEDGSELNYEVVKEIHLKSCTATYTRTMTVPYNTTVAGPTNISLTSGSDTTNQIKLPLTDLELGQRDKLSAVKFSFKSAEELSQFVGGCGISVDEAKVQSAAGVTDGWYQTGNIAVINSGTTFDVMWILPEAIRNGVYPDGEVLIGYWYGDNKGTQVTDITIPTVEYYVYRSTEEDIVITGEDGLELPDEIELTVGETYPIDSNVDGVTFESDRSAVASVDENGVITAVGEGSATITVKTPEGQEATITVKVVGAVTTTVTTTSVTTSTTPATSTTTATTTVDPDTVIDWDNVLYGDVDLNKKVSVADVTKLAKYLASNNIYPLQNATAKENADCSYDHLINNSDLSKLIEYCLTKISLDDLGPADKSNIPYYNQ
ncbi:MAG: DUF5620 domain-containing protein [Porcipelethomonas sp.]